MLFKSTCALVVTGALLIGDVLGYSPFEKFAERSRNKGRRENAKRSNAMLNKRASNSSSFRYLTNQTERKSNLKNPRSYTDRNFCSLPCHFFTRCSF